MKPSGTGWVVGKRLPRVIKGKATEQMIKPSYFSTAAIALPYFLGRASSKPRNADSPEVELILALMDAAGMELDTSLALALAAPDALAKRARGEESLASFSRRSGVSRRALRQLESGESEPLVGTLLRVILAGEDRP